MRWLIPGVGGTMGALLSLLVARACTYRASSVRYRMSVEVETPEGLRSGSSVIEATERRGPSLMMADRNIQWTVRGEAVVVDLPSGHKLFALLGDGEYHLELLNRGRLHGGAVPSPRRTYERKQWHAERSELRRLSSLVTLAPRDYPQLARFRNLADPSSIEAVQPENLQAFFGPGVRLARITLQATEDPLQTGIEKRLSWLPEYLAERKRLNGKTGSIGTSELADNLNGSAFQRK